MTHPPLPRWYPQIPKALEQLEAPGELYLTRGSLETLLGVSRRQAVNLMHATRLDSGSAQ